MDFEGTLVTSKPSASILERNSISSWLVNASTYKNLMRKLHDDEYLVWSDVIMYAKDNEQNETEFQPIVQSHPYLLIVMMEGGI